jgi:hypothetical protein
MTSAGKNECIAEPAAAVGLQRLDGASLLAEVKAMVIMVGIQLTDRFAAELSIAFWHAVPVLPRTVSAGGHLDL